MQKQKLKEYPQVRKLCAKALGCLARGGSERRHGAGGAGACTVDGGWSFRGRWGARGGSPILAASAPMLRPCPDTVSSCQGPSPCLNPEARALGTGGETLAGRPHRRARPQPLPFLGPGKRGHFCSQPPEGLGGPPGSGRKAVGNSRVPGGPDGILSTFCTR